MSFGGINLKKHSPLLIIWAVTVKYQNQENKKKTPKITEITAAKFPLDNKASNSTSDLHINESQGQYGCYIVEVIYLKVQALHQLVLIPLNGQEVIDKIDCVAMQYKLEKLSVMVNSSVRTIQKRLSNGELKHQEN